MLRDIYDVEAAVKIIGGAKLRIKEIHPCDYFLKSLNVCIEVLKKNDIEYSFVYKYLNNRLNEHES